MLTWPVFFIIILWYAKWLAWIGAGVSFGVYAIGSLGAAMIDEKNKSEEDKEFKKHLEALFKYFLVFAVSAILLSISHILLVCNVDTETGLMYVLGRDYVVSKGASSLIPKVGKFLESAADSLKI